MIIFNRAYELVPLNSEKTKNKNLKSKPKEVKVQKRSKTDLIGLQESLSQVSKEKLEAIINGKAKKA